MASIAAGYRASDMGEYFGGLNRVAAVDASRIDVEAHVAPSARAQLRDTLATGTRLFHHDLTPGAVGCFLSHVAVMRALVSDGGADVYLVLEDDAVLPPDLGARAAKILSRAPPGWDVIHLGLHWGVGDAGTEAGSLESTGLTANLTRVRHFWGTFAMLVSRAGAAKILREYERVGIDMQIDSLMSVMAKRGDLHVYATREKPVLTGDHGSHIYAPIREALGVDPFDLEGKGDPR